MPFIIALILIFLSLVASKVIPTSVASIVVFLIVIIWVVKDHLKNKKRCDKINEDNQNNLVTVNNEYADNQASKKPIMVNGYPLDYNNNYNQNNYGQMPLGYKPAKTGIGVFLVVNLVVGLFFAVFVGIVTYQEAQYELYIRSSPQVLDESLPSYNGSHTISLINDGTIQPNTNSGLILLYQVGTTNHYIISGHSVYINCQKYFDNLSQEQQAEFGSVIDFTQQLIDNRYLFDQDIKKYNKYQPLNLDYCYPQDSINSRYKTEIKEPTMDFYPLPPQGTDDPFRTQITSLFSPNIELIKAGDIKHLPEYDVNYKINTNSDFYQQLKVNGYDIYMEIYENNANKQELSDQITTNVAKTYTYAEPTNEAKSRFQVSDTFHIEDVSDQEFNIKTPYQKTINAYLSIFSPYSTSNDIIALAFFIYTVILAITYFLIKRIYIAKNKR